VTLDRPTRRLYATLGALSLATVLLAGLLTRPGGRVNPDRRPCPIELDEPKGLEPASSAAGLERAP
jgi:hypothetical protein